MNLNDNGDIEDYSEVIQDFENKMNMMEDHDNSSAVPAVHQLDQAEYSISGVVSQSGTLSLSRRAIR